MFEEPSRRTIAGSKYVCVRMFLILAVSLFQCGVLYECLGGHVTESESGWVH